MSEQSKDAELLPCPFCGSKDLEVHGKPGILNAHDDVGCNGCNAFTPAPTWNRRSLPVGVPDGYALVPVEPTPEILQVIDLLCDDHRAFDDSEAFWKYLLDSAPAAPTVKESLSVAPTVKAEQVPTGAEWIDPVALSSCGPVYDAGWRDGVAEAKRLNEKADMADAYVGAREDLSIWKRRALEAEQKVRHQEQIIDHLTLEAQGETRFGEPSLPAAGSAGEERCTTCDGTGDVHRADGEWLGECHCSKAEITESDEHAALHQLAFELGGTDGGEYLLDADDLDKLIAAALSAQQSAQDAPERVSVPVDLAERIATHLEWDGDESQTVVQYANKCDALAGELRALLASHGRGEA